MVDSIGPFSFRLRPTPTFSGHHESDLGSSFGHCLMSWEEWCFSLHSLLPVTIKSTTHNRTKIVNWTIFTLTYTSKIFCRDLTTDLERLATLRVLCCVVSDIIFSDIWPLSYNRYQILAMYRVNHSCDHSWRTAPLNFHRKKSYSLSRVLLVS